MKRVILYIAFIFISAFIAACGTGVTHDNTLVGHWSYTENSAWRYEFDSNGTGRRGSEPDALSFEWSTRDGSRLILHFGSGYLNDSWDYKINGDTLSLVRSNGQREAYSYAKVENSPDIIGSWVWDIDDSYLLTLHSDGTGLRGFRPAMEMFDWFNTDDFLIINSGTEYEEHWGYAVTDGGLNISSKQVAGMSYSYTLLVTG